MAEWVKVPAIKFRDMSSILDTRMTEENQPTPSGCLPTPTYVP